MIESESDNQPELTQPPIDGTPSRGERIPLCKQCCNSIPAEAVLCAICDSYQDWRRFMPISNTALALLTALVSTSALAAPAIYKLFHTPRSEATLSMPSIDGTTLRVVALNIGDAPASIIKAWVSSDYLAPATKVRLKNDNDAILTPGNKLLTFDIIPLLDEDDSYRSSMEMLSYIMENKQPPRTEIRFHLLQSDGHFSVEAITLDASDLFSMLRANADRCSAIKEINFENGCIGRGTPDEERFPRVGEKLNKDLVDSIETRINVQKEAKANNKKSLK